MNDCKHPAVIGSVNGRSWFCRQCGEAFVPLKDSYMDSLRPTVYMLAGKPLDYWFDLDEKLRECEAEKFALGQQLAEARMPASKVVGCAGRVTSN